MLRGWDLSLKQNRWSSNQRRSPILLDVADVAGSGRSRELAVSPAETSSR